MFYRICRVLSRIIFFLLYRLKAIGVEHVPSSGPVVLCSNHLSNIDPVLLATPLNRKVRYMAKAELFSVVGLRWLIVKFGAFPVKRGGVSKESIRTALNILENGEVLGIFPAGTRSNTVGMGKKGAASLALKTNATVIPVAIVGNYVPFRRMTVAYGRPLDLSEFSAATSEDLELATERIMQAISQLLEAHRR
jgi:1-acyl-sn-glycerol-3-phosphate acyltransferase